MCLYHWQSGDVIVHSNTQLQQGKGQRKELGKNSFSYVWKPEFQMNGCFACRKSSQY